MNASPFLRKKVILGREQSFWEGSVSRAVERAGDAFVRAIPSEDVKQLPPKYLYPVGGILFFILLGIFSAVFIPGYLSQIRARFLVPVGSGNSKYCDDVTISNTGTFLASREGLWQGAENFSYANGSYVFSVTNYQTTQSEFREQMRGVYEVLTAIGMYATTQNLGVNLLFWMSWTEVQPGFASQRITMSGTPISILNRDSTAGTVSNVLSDCNAPATSSFNPGSGELQVSYEVSTYMSNPNCSLVASPGLFGYKSYMPTDTFSIKFDARTLVTCVALNSMIVSSAVLQVTAQSTIAYKNTTYRIAAYVDPRYPGMRPVRCMYPGLPHNQPFCFMIVGAVYAVPVFNHAGKSFSLPEPCNCTAEKIANSDIATNPLNLCNVFNFLTGFIFYPYEIDASPVIELMFRYPNFTGRTINELAFTAMFTGGIFGRRATYDTPAAREAMYAFCKSERYGNCSIVIFNSVDQYTSSTDWIVASTYHEVPTGACSDSFSSTPEAWEQLVEQPFAPLTEQYETCSNDPTTALFTQAGVSAGNVSLLSPLGVLLVLALLAAYQFCSGAHIPRSYSRGDKDAALDALAVAMLLVRDRRLGPFQGDPPGAFDEKLDDKTAAGSTWRQSSEADGMQSKQEADRARLKRRKSGLADIVEELSEVALTAQQDGSLLHQSAPNVVFVDWSRLGSHIFGGSRGGGGNGQRGVPNTTASDSDVKGKAPQQELSHLPRVAAVVHGHEGRCADSDDDEVELPTISRMHQNAV